MRLRFVIRSFIMMNQPAERITTVPELAGNMGGRGNGTKSKGIKG